MNGTNHIGNNGGTPNKFQQVQAMFRKANGNDDACDNCTPGESDDTETSFSLIKTKSTDVQGIWA